MLWGPSAPLHFANIFMSEIEEIYIYPLMKNKAIIYLRLETTFVSTYRSKYNKKQPKFCHAYTNINHRFSKQLNSKALKLERPLQFFTKLLAIVTVLLLLEGVMCKNQYAGKSETSFNIRLNNDRKDTKKAKCHRTM